MSNHSYTNSYSSTRIIISQELLVLYLVQNNDIKTIIQNASAIEQEAMHDVLVLLSDSQSELMSELQSHNIKYQAFSTTDLTLKLKAGFEYGLNNGYKYMVEFDDDGQYDWTEIVKLYQKSTETNCDIVIGNRTKNRLFNMSKGDTKITNALQTKANAMIEDAFCFLRLFNDSAVNVYLSEGFTSYDPASYVFLSKKANLKFGHVNVVCQTGTNSWQNARINNPIYVTKQYTKILFGNVK
ncbi:hypothetical protein [Ureaplasma ceti]|uniref:Glycosyltransferase n=1 Tax=Ureaplasma ceti TaxID=3119530 RepID=A0ABP9U5Y6_9BACT